MAKVISIVNQKGGVGKTTTTVNLAAALVKNGKSVLAIDLDPQGNLTSCFGSDPDLLTETVSNVFIAEMNDEGYAPDYGIIYTTEGVDLLPSNISLASVEAMLITATTREFLLKSYIDSQRDNYDYILIDCPPSLSMITENALTASDSVIVPVQAQHLAALGLAQLLKTVERIRRKTNRRLYVEGLLITMYDSRTKMSKAIDEQIHIAYGNAINVFNTKLPTSAEIAKSAASGRSLLSFSPSHKATKAYESLAAEILKGGI